MDFPVVPDNLSELSDEALNELINELRDRAREVLASRRAGEDVSDELWAAASAAPEAIAALRSEKARRAADAAAEDAIEGLDDDDEDGDDEDDDEDDESEDDDSEATEEDDDEDEADEEAGDGNDDAPVPPAPGAGDLHDGAPGSTSRPAGGVERASRFTYVNGVAGHNPDDPVGDMTELAAAMQARYESIQGGSTEKIAVAQLRAHFTDEMEVAPTEAPIDFSDPDSITAGLSCVPREPLYDVGCASSTERPLMGSLPTKRAPRGGFSVYPSPMLGDVSDGSDGDGTGIWTRADDAPDSDAVKNACAVIPCGTPEDFDIYGVYRCITVRNLLQLTFPELVAAYLNKLGALWARLAETTLLDGMVNSPWSVDITSDVADNGLGATANLLDRLVQIVAVYTEQERYADGLTFGVWLHRWVATLIIRDFLKAPRYNPTVAELVMVRSQINTAFRNAGFNVHWTMDAATSWAEVGAQAEGELEGLPTVVDMKIAPEGNFQRLDLGTLTVGVTNRNPWDKDDMARNQFTMFWESYEGIIDNGCPSWNVQISPLCPTGQMHYAPAEAVGCDSETTSV